MLRGPACQVTLTKQATVLLSGFKISLHDGIKETCVQVQTRAAGEVLTLLSIALTPATPGVIFVTTATNR